MPRPQQFEHSGPGEKPLMPAPEVNHEFLVRMKKQRGIVELLKKMGGLINEKRLQLDENAKAERESHHAAKAVRFEQAAGKTKTRDFKGMTLS